MAATAAPTRGDAPWRRAYFFEDFRVGQQRVSNPDPCAPPTDAPPTDEDAGAGVGGSVEAGIASFLALVDRSGVLPEPPLRVLGAQWSEVQPGAAVRTTFTVTRCRRVPGEAAGSVRWHVRGDDAHGRTVQEGTVTLLVPARSDGAADDGGELACFTPAWGQALAARLEDDARFAAATATWDGSMGLRSGSDQVQLRVYRGRVIDAAARTPHGATFTVEAGESTWADLLTATSNDFLRRVMSSDAFSVSGSAYEYLRMTKALLLLIDAARDLTKEAAA